MVALSHSLLVLTVDGIDSIWFATFSELQGVQSAITRFLLVFFNGGPGGATSAGLMSANTGPKAKPKTATATKTET